MWNKKCSLIGMIHLKAMPGAPGFCGNVESILEIALAEALIYKESGFDAIMLENMHDLPYMCGRVEPETTAAVSVIARELKVRTSMPTGLQILAGANLEALGAAVAASLDFIRVEGYVFAHVGDEGIHQACAAALVRKRDQLKANHIKIFADIKKKHSAHAITADLSLADCAKAAEFFKADGVIITGSHTGHAPLHEDVEEVRAAVSLPVLVGSGVDEQNIDRFKASADALIIGSSLKVNGLWSNELDREKVLRMATKV